MDAASFSRRSAGHPWIEESAALHATIRSDVGYGCQAGVLGGSFVSNQLSTTSAQNASPSLLRELAAYSASGEKLCRWNRNRSPSRASVQNPGLPRRLEAPYASNVRVMCGGSTGA